MSGSGFAQGLHADLGSPPGSFGELGVYFAESWHTAIGLALRYTAAHYELNGTSIDASNIGLNLTLHLNP